MQAACMPWSWWKHTGTASTGHRGHLGSALGSVAACLYDHGQVPSSVCLRSPRNKTLAVALSCPWPVHVCAGWRGQWGHQALSCCVYWYGISSLCFRVLWWLFLTMKRYRRSSSSSGSTGTPASPQPSRESLTLVWAWLSDCDGWVGLITSSTSSLNFQYTITWLQLKNLAWGKSGRSRLVCWLQILSVWWAFVDLRWCLPSVGTYARSSRYIKKSLSQRNRSC